MFVALNITDDYASSYKLLHTITEKTRKMVAVWLRCLANS